MLQQLTKECWANPWFENSSRVRMPISIAALEKNHLGIYIISIPVIVSSVGYCISLIPLRKNAPTHF